MKVSTLSLPEIKRLCKTSGIKLKIGPFNFAITSRIPDIARNIFRVYQDFDIASDDDILDFSINIDKPLSLRRWFKPQVEFKLEGYSPFLPLPAYQAFPLMEWGMNWCIAQNSYDYLTIHAAVVEKNGFTAILPAHSGSGKSTLSAILVSNGWRLLSDEMTLINLQSLLVAPLARPVSLKNESISLIKQDYTNSVFSDVVDDTNKGTIGHLKPPSNSVNRINECSPISAFVFPKYRAGAKAKVEKKEKGEAFMEVIEQSFNYEILGQKGFETLTSIISDATCFDFVYSSTQDAIDLFEKLAEIND